MIRIFDLNEVSGTDIFSRVSSGTKVSDIVSDIIKEVRDGGDNALLAYTEKFDGVRPEQLEVTPQEIEDAFLSVSPELIRILKSAAKNITVFHSAQKRTGFILTGDGTVMGQRLLPLERVGLYVPGGTAAYPSTVLMDSIPAKVAGVNELIMVTPPGEDGKVNPAILTAAKIAGVDRIFKVGGAQAIAALAYGTESVPCVDKIVGPGNAFVAEAKRQVYGKVAIDMIAGPSEILIVSDEKTDPSILAADLLSQAEHDKMASAVLVTTSYQHALSVQNELEVQLEKLPRREIARISIDTNGKIIVCESIRRAIDVSNTLAPEHLELCIDQPFEYLDKVRHAGSVFLGRSCPEALGDYLAGPNHTLPTSGTARFSSPLSVDDFIKKMQYTYYSEDALNRVADDVALFAETEGLSAHARSAVARKGEVK